MLSGHLYLSLIHINKIKDFSTDSLTEIRVRYLHSHLIEEETKNKWIHQRHGKSLDFPCPKLQPLAIQPGYMYQNLITWEVWIQGQTIPIHLVLWWFSLAFNSVSYCSRVLSFLYIKDNTPGKERHWNFQHQNSNWHEPSTLREGQ